MSELLQRWIEVQIGQSHHGQINIFRHFPLSLELIHYNISSIFLSYLHHFYELDRKWICPVETESNTQFQGLDKYSDRVSGV